MTQGLPSTAGNLSFTLDWALSPTTGAGRTGLCVGGGDVQDAKALGAPHLTLAKGFDKPPPSAFCAPFVPLDSLAENGSGILIPPSPAFRSAICVVNLLSMAIWSDRFEFRMMNVCAQGQGMAAWLTDTDFGGVAKI